MCIRDSHRLGRCDADLEAFTRLEAGCELRLADGAFLFRDTMLIAHQDIGGCWRCGGSGFVALQFGMAKIAFIFIDTVLGAIQSLWVFDFRVTKETTIFVSVMFLAPEALGISF